MKLRKLEFNLSLPSRKLHPNGRVQWRQKASLIKKYKELNYSFIKEEANKYVEVLPVKRAVIAATYFLPSKNPRHQHDKDNLIAWSKTPVDLLELCGVVENDRCLLWKTPKQVVGEESLRLEIYVIDDEAETLIETVFDSIESSFKTLEIEKGFEWIETVLNPLK